MNRLLRWIRTPALWWHFWNPQSGAIGGLIGGLVIWSVWVLAHLAREVLQ